MNRIARSALAACACSLAALSARAQEPRLVPQPPLATHGQTVEVRIEDANVFLPATRYRRSGSRIVVEAEYLASRFGPFPRNVGPGRVALGELPPGNYTLEANLVDVDGGGARTLTTTLAVAPPESWGIYTVPAQPQAFAEAHAVIRSAAYFDPASMRASLSGSVVRVDFEFLPDAPASGPAPEGMQAYGSVPMPPLAPGHYVLEGWGRPKAGGTPERYFTQAITVGSSVPVVEYYSAALDHYFVAAGADEIAVVDRGLRGDWKRTGLSFGAWWRAADAPAGAVPVCRFYASGPNSHFYTGSASECDSLKALEQQDRALAQSRGEPFLGWGFEGIAFWTVMPSQGACPAGLGPVYRLYNDRAAAMDSNHRFTRDPVQREATQVGWVDEGAHLCSPP